MNKLVAARLRRAAKWGWAAVLAALCCASAFGAASAAGAVVERVRMHEAPEHTRVVLETTAPVKYSVFTLARPDRVVVDVGASLGKGLDIGKAARGHKRIAGVRTAPRGAGHRVVFDMAGDFEPRHFTLDPVAPYGHRLVIDLFERESAEPEAPPQPQTGERDVVVAIDAGHGGEDPGAVGANGRYEKTVVLQIARKLAARFNDTPGFRAVLVRDGDYYIPLRKRIAIARRERADMFVSVHADAFKHPSANGASVYALSATRRFQRDRAVAGGKGKPIGPDRRCRQRQPRRQGRCARPGAARHLHGRQPRRQPRGGRVGA